VPIDFAAIAAQFHDPLVAQTKPLEPLFERLEEAVKKIAEDAEKADRASRAYPILRYYGDALSVRVVPLEGIALLDAPPPLGFVEGLRTGGREFLAGIGWTRTAVTQELAVTRIAGVTVDALQAIVDSIDRFATPTPAMFDPRERRLSDVFGLLVLAYNSLLGPDARKQLVGAATGAMGLYEEYKKAFPDSEPPSTVGPIDRMVVTLDGLAPTLLDVVLLLPVLGGVLAVGVHDGSLAAKRRILTELSRVEADVVAMRTAAMEGVIAGAGLGGLAQAWLGAARAVIAADLIILTGAAPALLDGLLTGVRRFAEGVSAWGRWLTDLAEAIRVHYQAIMNFDLFGFVLRQILPSWLVDHLPGIPTVTVDDIVGLLIGQATSRIRDTLNTFFDAALFALWALPWDTDYYAQKLRDLRTVVNLVLTPTAFTLPPDVLPKGPIAGFPDIGEAFFGGGRGEALVASIDRLGTDLRGGVSDSLAGAETMLTALGGTFAAEADRAVVLGSPVQMHAFALDAAELSERVFGPEADRVREQAASRRPDVLAAAFESAVTSGGFALVGSAIPAYVGEMRRFWEQKRPPVDRPTSPHILARHGRLGAVRIPRMTMRAPGRAPDHALATAVAERFHSAVDDAYLEGRREFERLGGAPLRRPSRGARPARRGR
jgi:hypothetical protein